MAANGSGLKEVADLADKIMNGAIQFDNSTMLIKGTKPAISFKPLLSAAAFHKSQYEAQEKNTKTF